MEGNGPEAVIELVAVGVIGTLLWPPTRKAIHRYLTRKDLELHRKLDRAISLGEHIVKFHPDIPDLPEAPSNVSSRTNVVAGHDTGRSS